MKQKGSLDLNTLKKAVDADEIDTIICGFTDHYGRFMGKHVQPDFFFNTVLKSHLGACDYLLGVDIETQPIEGFETANWESGYGDFLLRPDLNTLRRASWLDKTAIVACDVICEKTQELYKVSPRSMLLKQLQNVEQAGFKIFAATELENFCFDISYEDAAENGYHFLPASSQNAEDYHLLHTMRRESFYQPVRRHLEASGIPVENTKGEAAPGQYELNVVYQDALTMADNHGILKQCVKSLAHQHDVAVTFMAKPQSDKPEQVGSSCHIHLSLWKGDKNIFAGNEKLGSIECSAEFKHFLAGVLAHLKEFMPFYAPTVNSYKRYQKGSWAPTTIAWSNDNRTTGLRIVGHGQSLRLENRIPGADVNPYLAFVALIASGMDGINNKLPLPEEFKGNAYAADELETVPKSLTEAIGHFENSDFVRKSLGDVAFKHYLHFYKSEQEAYDKAVTDWERQRYFEEI